MLLNEHVPNEDSEVSSDLFADQLAIIEELIGNNLDCHATVGGDFSLTPLS